MGVPSALKQAKELLGKDGLDNKLVETGLVRCGSGGYVREPGERNETLRATFGARAQPTSHLATVDAWEMKIDHGDIPGIRIGTLERLMEVGGFEHAVPHRNQELAQHAAEIVVVLDNQHTKARLH